MDDTFLRPDDFPETESFQDCCGEVREFQLELLAMDGGFFVRATEENDGGEGGYVIAAYSESSPYRALGKLREKARRHLATRYLSAEDGRRSFSHDVAKGYISYGGVVFDGEFVPFEEFAEMLQTYEGWQLSLRITDIYDEP
jgi:hypothetical protein